LAIDNIEVDDHVLRASYGTTKYCTFFLKNLDCPNKECLYLHVLADDGDIINRDDMSSSTNIFYEQQLLAMKLADVFNTEVKKKLKTVVKKKCIFPTTDTIYSKDIVLEQEGDYKYYGNYNTSTGGGEYKGYYDNYYGSRYDHNYNDYYGHEEEGDNSLTRERSEKLSHKEKFGFGDTDTKFISKSKSPIVSKKKLTNLNNSLSPGRDKGMNINSDDTNVVNNISTQKKLYCARETSRFDFVKNNNNVDDVPEFVNEVIGKKCSRHSFFNKFVSEFEDNLNDCIYFEKELKKDHSWSQFILKNLENK
jgi:hypothetical protein